MNLKRNIPLFIFVFIFLITPAMYQAALGIGIHNAPYYAFAFALTSLFLASPPILMRVLIVFYGIATGLQLINLYHLGYEIYPEQIEGFIDSPGLAIGIGKEALSLAAIGILFSCISVTAYIATRHCSTSPVSYYLISFLVATLALISLTEVYRDRQLPGPFAIISGTLGYYFPHVTRKSAIEKDWPTESPTVKYSNIYFLLGESVSGESKIVLQDDLLDFSDLPGNQVSFNDVTSLATFTSKSFLSLFVGGTFKGPIKELPTIPMFAKAAGYEVTFASSRNLKWANLELHIQQGTDHIVDSRTLKGLDITTHQQLHPSQAPRLDSHDDKDVMRKMAYPVLAKNNQFMIWFMDSAHAPYEDARMIKGDRSDYFSAVHYWSENVKTFAKKMPENSLLIVTADHGALHTDKTLRVPLVIYSTHPEDTFQSPELQKNTTRLANHSDLRQTLVGMIGYSADIVGYDLNSELIPAGRERTYMDPRGDRLVELGSPESVINAITKQWPAK